MPLRLDESRPVGYVQDDVAWARSHEYGSRVMAKEDRARLRDPNIAYRKSLSHSRQKAYDIAMDGDRDAVPLKSRTPGSCAGQAEKTLYGDPAAWFRADVTVSNLRPLYVGKQLRCKEFKSAVGASLLDKIPAVAGNCIVLRGRASTHACMEGTAQTPERLTTFRRRACRDRVRFPGAAASRVRRGCARDPRSPDAPQCA